MEYQVRRYQIGPGRLDEFIEAWKSGVVPLRRQFGSRFHGAWSIAESNEFVWVISHDGEEGFATADATYYESEDRRLLSPDPAVQVVGSNQDIAERVL
jgi:hypothetical protein